MGTTSPCSSTSTPREETTTSHLERLPVQALRPIASLSTHPLISVAAAAYVLAVLYIPRHLLSLLLSPVSLTTFLLLTALLHLGSSAPSHPPQEDKQRRLPPCPPCTAATAPAAVPKTPPFALGTQQKPVFSSERHQYRFVDRARRGPLEVIYEEYEGEAEADDDLDEEDSPVCTRSPGRTRPLGLLQGVDSRGMCCYDTDGSDEEDSGSDSPAWDSQEDLCFRWEVEDDGLIEIALEEDNLIEIDLSACR